MKTLILLFLLTISFAGYSSENIETQAEKTVIVCTGKYAKRYHNAQCRGLKNCKGDSVKISLSDAKKKGYTECGYCYKK